MAPGYIPKDLVPRPNLLGRAATTCFPGNRRQRKGTTQRSRIVAPPPPGRGARHSYLPRCRYNRCEQRALRADQFHTSCRPGILAACRVRTSRCALCPPLLPAIITSPPSLSSYPPLQIIQPSEKLIKYQEHLGVLRHGAKSQSRDITILASWALHYLLVPSFRASIRWQHHCPAGFGPAPRFSIPGRSTGGTGSRATAITRKHNRFVRCHDPTCWVVLRQRASRATADNTKARPSGAGSWHRQLWGGALGAIRVRVRRRRGYLSLKSRASGADPCGSRARRCSRTARPTPWRTSSGPRPP